MVYTAHALCRVVSTQMLDYVSTSAHQEHTGLEIGLGHRHGWPVHHKWWMHDHPTIRVQAHVWLLDRQRHLLGQPNSDLLDLFHDL